MPKKNYSRFTSNGYSHTSLNRRVSKLVKNNSISRTQARKLVAAEIGYPGWKQVIYEPVCESRDQFFGERFYNKSNYQSHFDAYRESHNLADTSDNYRRFLVQQHEVMESLIKKESKLQTKKISVDTAIKELMPRLESMGPESYLPQHLPDYLLQPMIEALGKWLENPTIVVDDDDEDFVFMMKIIMEVVFVLKAAAILIDDPNHPNKFSFNDEEIFENMEAYHLQLSLESLSRNTYAAISKPTLKNLLDPDAEMAFKFTDEAVDRMQKI